MKFYCLRYLPDVPLRDRKHQVVDRRFESWANAEDYRETLPSGDRLEVVEREVPAPKVVPE